MAELGPEPTRVSWGVRALAVVPSPIQVLSIVCLPPDSIPKTPGLFLGGVGGPAVQVPIHSRAPGGKDGRGTKG